MAYNGITSSTTTTASMPQPPRAAWWQDWYTLRRGRYYGTFKPGKYLLPCDDQECDRLDIMHKLFSVIRQFEEFKGLYTCPLPERPKVLDLGCGTGIWAIEMADWHRGRGQFEGWDLNLTQPEEIPPNASFKRRDIEDPWTTVDPDSLDMINVRMLNGSIENWPRLYHQIFRHLQPGGVFEQVEIDWRPQSDTNPRPLAESKLMEWSQLVHQGFARAGRKLEMDPNTQSILEDIGFTVEHRKIPIPMNPWPVEEPRKEIARWFNLGLNLGIEGLTLEAVCHYLGYPEQEMRDLMEKVKEDSCKREWRTFCTVHLIVARRPPLPGRQA
ncbi:S-adenosyl-L-methionine-dependent methyltransferase [Astrocystis sublimbata]|nr:S-adenosyl-L-methionine-dependent methyltransferase [Astrocystis sublimbata]